MHHFALRRFALPPAAAVLPFVLVTRRRLSHPKVSNGRRRS